MDTSVSVDKVVLVFTKYPFPGFAKTRLIPAVGAAAAADISRSLSERCLRTVRSFCSTSGARAIVYYATKGAPDAPAGADERLLRGWLAPQEDERAAGAAAVTFRRQCDGDLGERLAEAFLETFEDAGGRRRAVVVVGVDIPELSGAVLESAFEELRRRDAVVGPAADGGYYLLGLRAASGGVFEGVAWGGSEVFEMTERNFRRLGLSWGTLGVLRDVDLPEDLEYYYSIVGGTTGR